MNNPNNPNTSTWEFYTWNDTTKAYSMFETPWIWYSYTINWQNVNFDMWFPYHWTFVLYSSDTHHSIQLIWSKRLIDKVLYVDPYQSSDNVYVIDFYQWKAWSVTYPTETELDKKLLSALMFWWIWNTDEFLKSFKYMADNDWKSYTIETWWTYFFPPTYSQWSSSYYDSSDGYHEFSTETSYYWLTRYYKPDWQFESPDWEFTEVNNYNEKLVNDYNQCVNKWENLRKALHLAVMCKNQDENTIWENIIIRTWLDYTWTASYCLQLDNYVVDLYSVYSWNWATWIFSYDVNLQDNSLPINQLIFAWYYHSVVVDNQWNISWLPSWNSWCAAYTLSNYYDENKTWVEKIADEITSFFGTGVARYYQDTIDNWQSFWWLIDSIKNWTSWYFTDYLFDPYIVMFNSWYNDFHNKIWVWSCSDIQNSVWSLVLWDYALYIVAFVIIFILIMLL